MMTQVQHLAFSFVEHHENGHGPLIQPNQIPLQFSYPHEINMPTQLSVVCKLTEGALNPLIHITDKDIKKILSKTAPNTEP